MIRKSFLEVSCPWYFTCNKDSIFDPQTRCILFNYIISSLDKDMSSWWRQTYHSAILELYEPLSKCMFVEKQRYVFLCIHFSSDIEQSTCMVAISSHALV